jgi:rare lipoprotein A
VSSVILGACTCLPKGQADLDVGMKGRGIASWYGEDFHGWLTANGEVYDMDALTAAHRTLPLGTVLRVTNVENGRQVLVRINDRGPYWNGRILDLSLAAAKELDMVERGIAAIQLDVVAHRGVSGSGFGSDTGRTLPWWLLADLAPSKSASKGVRLAQPKEVRSLRPHPNDATTQRRIRRVTAILASGRRTHRVPALPVA